MKVHRRRGREALYIECVHMPTDSISISFVYSCCDRLKEDVFSFTKKEKVVLRGNFNINVGRSAQRCDVHG